MKPSRFHSGNINCLECNEALPFYQPSIKNNWERAISDGYDPKNLLRQACSDECFQKCKFRIMCSWCHKKCKPGTEFSHYLDKIQYCSLSINPQTSEASIIESIEHKYTSDRLCSLQCQRIIHREHNTLCNKYFISRSMHIENPIGLLTNNEIIQDLRTNFYTIRDKITILNPNAPAFVGNT